MFLRRPALRKHREQVKMRKLVTTKKNTKGRVILAVDDMGLNLRAVKMALDDSFDVRLAKSGEMALSVLVKEKVELILLDIEMPEMSGFDFMQRFKSSTQITPKPPVIFVTAHATPELLARAKIAGAIGYVLKPFDPDVLRKKVFEALGLSLES
jgi:putative two-component system response regulator